MGIRSEPQLCDEVHLNLAYRSFCRLDPGDAGPDHSTLLKKQARPIMKIPMQFPCILVIIVFSFVASSYAM